MALNTLLKIKCGFRKKFRNQLQLTFLNLACRLIGLFQAYAA